MSRFISSQCAQKVGPILHHLPAFRQILGTIVYTPYLVTGIVGKLLFNGIGGIPLLIEDGACHRAEAVGAHFIFFKAHAPQGGDKGRVTDGLFLGSETRKHQASASGEFA